MSEAARSGLAVTLYGVNGLTWDLLSNYSPVWIKRDLGGLHFMDTSAVVSTAAGIPGQRFLGASVGPRVIPMQIMVGDQQQPYRTGQDWRNLDARFWESLPLHRPVILEVEDSRGGIRSIQCRLDNSVVAMTQDPAIFGKQAYDIELVADWPFWQGPTRVFSFIHEDVTNEDYYGPTGLGPPFYIGGQTSFQSTAVANEGDEDAWVIWRLHGPGKFAVGVSDSLIDIPFELAPGQEVVINTDPRKQTISTGDTNLWPSMGSSPVKFAPVPIGESVLVTVQIDNPSPGTWVEVELTPQFHRAWGYRP